MYNDTQNITSINSTVEKIGSNRFKISGSITRKGGKVTEIHSGWTELNDDGSVSFGSTTLGKNKMTQDESIVMFHAASSGKIPGLKMDKRLFT